MSNKNAQLNEFLALNNLMRVQTAEAERTFLEQAKDVSMMQSIVLTVIAKHQPCTMSLIAKEMQLTPGAVTQAIDKLITKKLVKRLRSETDRRVVYAKLTAKGAKLVELQDETVKAVFRGFAVKLTNRETEQLLKIMRKLVA